MHRYSVLRQALLRAQQPATRSSRRICSITRRFPSSLSSIPHPHPHPSHPILKCTIHTTLPPYSALTSFPDPSRPDLFYHFLDAPTPLHPSLPAFALSFLPTPPARADSASIIGWLPAQIYEADAERQDDLGLEKQQDAGLHDFHPNPEFIQILHQSIKDGLRDQVDDIQINGGRQLQDGWMHIHDQRNIPALGRIGDPDDIIASVLVKDSEIQPETYQPMPSYRVCTVDGITQLTPGLAKRLNESLARVLEAEVKGVQAASGA
ncbi:hypothetical protein BDQ12DRAFT_694114 [Crucibulum laeve]|uniref:Uncharacterized protein n=1 Tax=Crucibulum laeve TaxID=68775 RepID=A0A5C3LFD4_9AGAR|nr:hypothetical protein BDQ12DRAFT_694114 [Crucibulum laeve]